MKKVLTIAGSDSSGGAGIQADIKTMSAHGVFAMSAITAITAQNTKGVTDIFPVSMNNLKAQIDAVFTDIFPDSVKIGMLAGRELIETVADMLEKYKAKNIVLDPVMVATSGSKLIEDEGIEIMKNKLFPLATIITPNIPETEILCNMPVKNYDDMKKAAKMLGEKWGCAVLCKGGHRVEDANDILYNEGKFTELKGIRVSNENTHGTGCTLSSAIASNLAKEMSIEESVSEAKKYIYLAISQNLNLGYGKGPVKHNFNVDCDWDNFLLKV